MASAASTPADEPMRPHSIVTAGQIAASAAACRGFSPLESVALGSVSTEVLQRASIPVTVSREAPYASIDIHNNTGNNPHYACVTSLNDRDLHLARLFSRTIVYFKKPVGVQTSTALEDSP